jgi:hypothetical protein
MYQAMRCQLALRLLFIAGTLLARKKSLLMMDALLIFAIQINIGSSVCYG